MCFTCKEFDRNLTKFFRQIDLVTVYLLKEYLLVVNGHLFDFVAKHGGKDLVDSRSFVNSGHRILSESVSEAEGNN
jgi:hypothetical protein